MNLRAAKLRPPQYYEREIARYDEKLKAAINPTQRSYAYKMKQEAEKALKRSRGGVLPGSTDDEIVDLDKTDYHAF